MSAIEKAAVMLREEAEGIKESHTLRGDWCGDPAEADYHEMIAVADAAIAERDELLAALQRIADGQEMSGVFTFADVVLRYQEIARAAIAKATGEQL
jgi:hypothetical protein